MRVHGDADACVGAGQCVVLAPAVFDLDDDGKVVVLYGTPPEEQRSRVADAVAACPSFAIEIEDRA